MQIYGRLFMVVRMQRVSGLTIAMIVGAPIVKVPEGDPSQSGPYRMLCSWSVTALKEKIK